jgi:hypothetical protein
MQVGRQREVGWHCQWLRFLRSNAAEMLDATAAIIAAIAAIGIPSVRALFDSESE